MANNINIGNPAGLPGSTQRTASQQANGADPKSSAAAHTGNADRVSVTSEATRLREIEEQLMAVPEVNDSKVAEIRNAIADGTFDFNPERIAEKLVAFESRNDEKQ